MDNSGSANFHLKEWQDCRALSEATLPIVQQNITELLIVMENMYAQVKECQLFVNSLQDCT